MIAPTIVDSAPQVQAPRTWDKATAQAQVGDYIRVPFAPVMSVVNRDVLETGQIWLLVDLGVSLPTLHHCFKALP